MKGKKKLAIAMFFLLGLSTMVFGGFLLYRTAQVDGWSGTSTVMGMVFNTDGSPLQDVEVSWGPVIASSGEDGKWELENVDEGLITIEFYRPGFVLKTIKWLVYPLYELGDDIEDGPNNVSRSYDIELSKEMEETDISQYSGGTLKLVVDGGREELSSFTNVRAGPEDDALETLSLGEGPTEIDIEGNGHFYVALDSGDVLLRGFHPAGNTIDITDALIDSLETDEPAVWKGDPGEIRIDFKWEEEQVDPYTYSIIERYGNTTVDSHDASVTMDSLLLELDPGIYRLELYGKDIRDKDIRWLQVVSGENVTLEVQVEKGDVDSEFEDLSVRANYTLSVSYILISLVFFFGGYYIRKNGSWGVLLVLAFIGFLSQGFLTILIFNINHIFALVLVLVLISMRGEYNRRRQALMSRKYSSRA
ncbi:MAG: hypothetical protein ACMUHB_03365 [Thermoplasmatota archaeon]